MDWILNLLTNGISQHLVSILTALGGVVALVAAFISGGKRERDKGVITTQKETIDAYKDRRTAEDIVRGTPVDDPNSVRNRYQRDRS